ncbi:MAG: hypothetical protein ACTSU3_09315 [Candidatus Thorarchaeota archaeon]
MAVLKVPENPYQPLEMWADTKVSVKEDDERKKVNAKHYHVRYIVGEGSDKQFVYDGEGMEAVEDETLVLSPTIHKLLDEPFHFDRSGANRIFLQDDENRTKKLSRAEFCGNHELVEVVFDSPGVECCSMTKDEADEQSVPIQYLSGYLLGKSNDMVKIALAKTVLETGSSYYEHIHVIPESSVKDLRCLE